MTIAAEFEALRPYLTRLAYSQLGSVAEAEDVVQDAWLRLQRTERAALAWTEALTLVAATGAPDADYDLLKREFTESEQVNLTLQIGAINLWNRLQVGLRAVHPVDKARDAA